MDQETKQRQKSESLKQLKEIALAHHRTLHPNFPETARYIKPYSDKTASGLQRAITDFLIFSGHQCERISVTGRYIDTSKVVTDTLGFKKKIGSGEWIKGSMQPGSADLSAIIYAKSVKIEIKIGSDKMSDLQKRYQAQVERAGGIYLVIRSFDEFLDFYNELL